MVGVCRFPLPGRGDWKAYRGVPDDRLDAIHAEKAAELFAPARMEDRLATFEHLTLASLRAQTDRDFRFLVLASDRMPQPWRDRLAALCATMPQAVLRFFPPIHAAEAQARVFQELGIDFGDTLQFRLDDDALCAGYVAAKRRAVARLVPSPFPFAASFRSVLVCARPGVGANAGVYLWSAPFFSAGAAICHPGKSVFGFGHFSMARRFTSIVVAGGMSLATHNGSNDTLLSDHRIRRSKMVRLDAPDVRRHCDTHFPFLSATARALAGLPGPVVPG